MTKATLVIPSETDAPSGPGQLSILSVFVVGLGAVLLFWWLSSGDVPVKTMAAMGLAGLEFIERRSGYEAYAIDKELRGHWTTEFDDYCEQNSGVT